MFIKLVMKIPVKDTLSTIKITVTTIITLQLKIIRKKNQVKTFLKQSNTKKRII